MSGDDALDRSIREMRTHFLVPPGPEDTFSRLDALVDSLLPEYRSLAEAFKHSLSSTLSTVAMPFSLATASVHQSHFQRLHIAERIRARSIELDSIKPGEDLEEVRQREAYRVASERMREFAESEEGKNAIIWDVCGFLLAGLRDGELESATKELIQQGTILVWSAFEVLFRDVFELHLNLNPSKAKVLAQDTSTRKRFEAERFSLDTLVKHGFDLSNRVGTVLVSQQDFGDLPTIKTVYPVLFPGSGELLERLNDPDLWLLYQRRHLLVHRRGIVDQTYLDNTSDTAPINAPLPLKPKDFEAHFKVVLLAGEALLSCLPVVSGHREGAAQPRSTV